MQDADGRSGAMSHDDEVEQQLKLASLALDLAGDAIIIHRPDGTIVRFNQAAASQIGLTVDEFGDLPPWGWSAEMSDEARATRLAAIKQKGGVTFVSSITRPDGLEAVHDVHTRWVDAPTGSYIVAVSRDITEQVRAHEVLENLAFHDPLTGLANRALFEDRLEVAISNARRHEDLLGVAFIDLDDFKDINDAYGHAVGDQVLIALAHRLEGSIRQGDTVARLGGDEFVVIFPRVVSAGDFEALADKLIARVHEPVVMGDNRFNLRASVGLATFMPDDDARSLLMRADIEMYEAKRTSPTSRRAVLKRRD
ncbi:MAG: sensor domain-containing diguanylate cyclase [Coriobacteriia bacterium]|nr:sensor domain-containing diguanylate cyclase [Coriobacteriia bacterium]